MKDDIKFTKIKYWKDIFVSMNESVINENVNNWKFFSFQLDFTNK